MLNVYASLTGEVLIHVGDVAPGVQTFTTEPDALTSGNRYYFTVKATDVNGLQGPQGGWSAVVGPLGVPGAPTNIQAVLS
jgi:hypothetical protein